MFSTIYEEKKCITAPPSRTASSLGQRSARDLVFPVVARDQTLETVGEGPSERRYQSMINEIMNDPHLSYEEKINNLEIIRMKLERIDGFDTGGGKIQKQKQKLKRKRKTKRRSIRRRRLSGLNTPS